MAIAVCKARWQARQISRETNSRESIGKDSMKFSNALMLGSTTLHVSPASLEKMTGKEDVDDEEGKGKKEKKAPLAERLVDT